jgi:hypothetical protein
MASILPAVHREMHGVFNASALDGTSSRAIALLCNLLSAAFLRGIKQRIASGPLSLGCKESWQEEMEGAAGAEPGSSGEAVGGGADGSQISCLCQRLGLGPGASVCCCCCAAALQGCAAGAALAAGGLACSGLRALLGGLGLLLCPRQPHSHELAAATPPGLQPAPGFRLRTWLAHSSAEQAVSPAAVPAGGLPGARQRRRHRGAAAHAARAAAAAPGPAHTGGAGGCQRWAAPLPGPQRRAAGGQGARRAAAGLHAAPHGRAAGRCRRCGHAAHQGAAHRRWGTRLLRRCPCACAAAACRAGRPGTRRPLDRTECGAAV